MNTSTKTNRLILNAVPKKSGNEKYLTNARGEIEFIVLPIKEYEKLIELIEDYGLGLAMKAAEAEKVYEKEAALRYLENA